ncbi:hypothetical protein BDA99DRAFT_509484 [Phascolomyces articulosus]|uniref:Uncharacterized protein n=1 Tax=Phascolomyces articulosus TaxID=60185 RepID=A0AAD5KAH2_9FUNG|nr:hypothetical protein BDA99DRAFT_509484 [Phascolomyces articulosus]
MYYGAIVWTVIAIVVVILLFLILRWHSRRKGIYIIITQIFCISISFRYTKYM